MYCIKQISPSVRTLYGPTFPTIQHYNSNKKSVRFSKDNDVILIPPRTHKMKR